MIATLMHLSRIIAHASLLTVDIIEITKSYTSITVIRLTTIDKINTYTINIHLISYTITKNDIKPGHWAKLCNVGHALYANVNFNCQGVLEHTLNYYRHNIY